MQRTTMHIRGQRHEWVVNSLMPEEQIKDMRNDGIDVCILEYSMPAWVADIGLGSVWCFFEDIFRLRNPFRIQRR